MVHQDLAAACQAAFWLMDSEARRQQAAVLPDCDWKQFERDGTWVATVLSAQAELCRQAMQSPKPPQHC